MSISLSSISDVSSMLFLILFLFDIIAIGEISSSSSNLEYKL